VAITHEVARRNRFKVKVELAGLARKSMKQVLEESSLLEIGWYRPQFPGSDI